MLCIIAITCLCGWLTPWQECADANRHRLYRCAHRTPQRGLKHKENHTPFRCRKLVARGESPWELIRLRAPVQCMGSNQGAHDLGIKDLGYLGEHRIE